MGTSRFSNAAVQGCAGQNAGDVCLRSGWRRGNEPQIFETGEGKKELHLSEREKEDGCWAENFFRCQARAGPVRGGDRGDQMREVQFQQAESEIRGGVYYEGADGNFGSQYEQVAAGFKRRCAGSGGGVMKEKTNKRFAGDGDRGKTDGPHEKGKWNFKNIFLSPQFPDRHYLLKVRPAKQEAFVRFETPPGEEAQVDWGLFGDYFGCGRILSCFAFVLSHSRMATFIWTLSQSLDDFLRAHVKAFHFFGGVPQRILYDNLKNVVLKRLGIQIQFQPRFMALAGHYLFEPRPCNVRRGNEKGKVERSIGYLRENFFAGRSFKDLWDLRNQSDHWRDTICNVRVHGSLKQRPWDRFEEEKGALRNLPAHPFDTDTCVGVKASPDCRVIFDTNTYSVPSIYAHLGLTLKANDSHLFHEFNE